MGTAKPRRLPHGKVVRCLWVRARSRWDKKDVNRMLWECNLRVVEQYHIARRAPRKALIVVGTPEAFNRALFYGCVLVVEHDMNRKPRAKSVKIVGTGQTRKVGGHRSQA